MNKLSVIEIKNQRVLLATHIAEAFKTDLKSIHKNFSRNKNRYEEGKHYFILQGEELKEFKTTHQIDGQLKHSPIVYLYTVKGVFLHAKSLNTDEAWDAYNNLVDDYFKKIEEQQTNLSQLSPQLQFMIMMEQKQNALEAKQTELENENSELRQSMRHLSLVVDNEIHITDQQCAEIQEAVNKRVGELMAMGYEAHFQSIFRTLKTHFTIPKYNKLKRTDFEQAMDLIRGWFPKKKENSPS